MAGTNFFAPNSGTIQVALSDLSGNAILVKCTAANIPSGAGYAIGCELIATDTGAHYYNTGTATAATFVLSNAGGAYVTKFAGTATGGTTATRAYTITGALSTDIATAVIRASTNAASIQKATLTTDTLTVLFSTDPGASTTVDYTISRAV